MDDHTNRLLPEFTAATYVCYMMRVMYSDMSRREEISEICGEADRLHADGCVDDVEVCTYPNSPLCLPMACFLRCKCDRDTESAVAVTVELAVELVCENYRVHIRDVHYAYCQCPNGKGPLACCKHVCAFLVALRDMTERSPRLEENIFGMSPEEWNRRAKLTRERNALQRAERRARRRGYVEDYYDPYTGELHQSWDTRYRGSRRTGEYVLYTIGPREVKDEDEATSDLSATNSATAEAGDSHECEERSRSVGEEQQQRSESKEQECEKRVRSIGEEQQCSQSQPLEKQHTEELHEGSGLRRSARRRKQVQQTSMAASARK